MGYSNFVRSETLKKLILRDPFKPFEIELSSGWKCAIRHPEAIMIRNGTVGVLDAKALPHIFDVTDIVRVSQLGRPRK